MGSVLSVVPGTLVGPHGEPLLRPTHVLTGEDKAVVRAYRAVLTQLRLQPELVCQACYDNTRASHAVYEVTPQQILVACGCRMLFGDFTTVTPAPIAIQAPTQVLSGTPELCLPQEVSQRLRHYRRFLLAYGLKEALRCLACWDLGQRDGCRAYVGSEYLEIVCRCQKRYYRGST